MKKKPQGFIALMSALVISAVTLMLALGGGLSGFYTRVNAINGEYKERSFALAEACVSQTLIVLINDPSYSGNATTTVSGANGSCYTGSISKTGVPPNDTYSFKTRAYVGNAYTFLSIRAAVSDLDIVSQLESANF